MIKVELTDFKYDIGLLQIKFIPLLIEVSFITRGLI